MFLDSKYSDSSLYIQESTNTSESRSLILFFSYFIKLVITTCLKKVENLHIKGDF